MNSHSDSNAKEHRTKLFSHLDAVLKLAREKIGFDQKKDETRIKWGRLLTQAVDSYGRLLQSEELELRVLELEKKLEGAVLIPHERNK